MTEKPLNNLKLSDLWKEFKLNFYQSSWDETNQHFKLLKKRYIESDLEYEITFYTNAKPY